MVGIIGAIKNRCQGENMKHGENMKQGEIAKSNLGAAMKQWRDRPRASETPLPPTATQTGNPKTPVFGAPPKPLDDGRVGTVRLKDIAQDLGLSFVTVSKVLRNQDDVSNKTRRLVLERAKALNYKPNLSARALATGRTRLVGLVVPDLLHTYFAQIAKSLSRTLLKKGYCLTISASEENPEMEGEILDRLLAWRPDALIIASAAENSEQIARIQKQGTPLLLIDRRLPNLAANYIGADNEVVGALATEHLISVGCRRIAHLRGRETSTGTGRLNGYLKALGKHGIGTHADFVPAMKMAGVPTRENGAALMRRLLALNPVPDGVFCYNDPMAVGAIDAILAAGLGVPEDIAVIGSGNLYYGADLRVPLSSIDQQTQLIGERAAKLILSLMDGGKPTRPKSFVIQPQLVVRASTQRDLR
jgi:LacI family transcriptional regulator